MNEKIPSLKNGGIHPVLIEEELKDSFLDYAMSVVVSRAIPDARDGLKPVHRRVLYAMYELGFHHNKPHRKSARVVGDVIGKFHPHGELAVYNTIVGMVQTFSKRYPLLDGQGNWGSVDGDEAAAQRYTEVRMEKITAEILADLEKETVPFVPNFDESTVEPTVLPSKLPNLLINGTTGIAVGMATSIPPHNLTEVVNGCLAYLKNPEMTDDELLSIIQAPDFPTGGIICGRSGIIKAYKTGRGNVILRGVVSIEETKKSTALVITELPYQVNKAELTIKIADLVKNKVIESITNIRDESDREGMRLVIEIKKSESPEIVLNQLYKFTNLQTSIAIFMLALLDNRPVLFTLRRLISEFLIHRRHIIYKRTEYDLKKSRAREHILEGFIIALHKLDEVIAAIKSSQDAEQAARKLNARFNLTDEQVRAILEMRLHRLTGLEQDKIHKELEEIRTMIKHLMLILSDEAVLRQEIVNELNELKELYGDKRKTQIGSSIDILEDADLIPDAQAVVTLTKRGYIKRVPLETYGLQHRGGKGKMGISPLDESQDLIQDVFLAKTHDEVLFFTNFGRVYGLQVFEIPEASRTAKGRAIVNLIPLQEGEFVVKLLSSRDLEGKYVVMLTKQGLIKRTEGDAFIKIRSTGIRAITLHDDDALVFCSISAGSDSIVIATAHGMGIRFQETEVRPTGRTAAGVIGIRLREGDEVVGMQVVADDRDLLFATERGYGKRVRVGDFRVAHRSGFGVRTIPTDKRNGKVIDLVVVSDESHLLLIDSNGKIIRLSPKEIRTMGRQAKGVRLIRLESDRILAAVVAYSEDGVTSL